MVVAYRQLTTATIPMNTPTLDEYKQRQLAKGFDEVTARTYAPNEMADTHTHPFSVEALVVEGEMWLTCGDETKHLRAGDSFAMDRGTPHAEKYGSDGAVYWAARKHGR
jgi:quercetin dioxygenase-like cupin family protein